MKAALFFFILILISSGVLVVHQQRKFNDGNLHIVFCDVGQGDAVLIRTPNGSDILYDGGPDEKVLGCLSEHIPFWDRRIELMLLSHPHADHLIGLLSVLRRYTVLSFDTEELRNETAMYVALEALLQKQQTRRRYVLKGDRFRTADGVELRVLGPSAQYLKETSPGGIIGERKEFASVVVHVRYKDFDLLLTGDSQMQGIRDALDGKSLHGVDVMQVPHHGSGTGLDREVIEKLLPKLAVISVGKNNYGHPAKSILGLLTESNVKILRTDKNGNVEVVSDGEKLWVR